MSHIDPAGPQPPYLQIADDLTRKISAGELGPGDRLPSSRDMMAEYGVASMTVHLAINTLRERGLIVSSPGRGVYVQSSPGEGNVHQDETRTLGEEIQQLRGDLEVLTRQVASTQEPKAVHQLRQE